MIKTCENVCNVFIYADSLDVQNSLAVYVALFCQRCTEEDSTQRKVNIYLGGSLHKDL